MLVGLCIGSTVMHLRCAETTLLKNLFLPFHTYFTSHSSADWFQAFKLVVNDPDSILNSLTREVKETGPDGVEVTLLAF